MLEEAQDRRYMMRRLRELGDMFFSGSWRVAIDAPRELGFAAYIGRVERFSPDSGSPPSSEAEAEWRAWWDNLPRATREVRSEIDRVVRALRAGNPPSGRPPGLWLGPPDFPDLADTPRVRELCRRHWGRFQDEWESIRWQLISGGTGVPDMMPHIDLPRLVAECQRSTGKRGRAFDLEVDFVEWPRDYKRVAAQGYLILGSSYQEAERVDALRETLRQRITALLQAG